MKPITEINTNITDNTMTKQDNIFHFVPKICLYNATTAVYLSMYGVQMGFV